MGVKLALQVLLRADGHWRLVLVRWLKLDHLVYAEALEGLEQARLFICDIP